MTDTVTSMADRQINQGEVTIPRVQSFVAAVDYERWKHASQALKLGPRTVEKNVRALEAAYNRPLIKPGMESGKLEPTDFGRLVYDEAKHLLESLRRLEVVEERSAPATRVAILPHHAAFIARVMQHFDGSPDLNLSLEILGEQHRSTDQFKRRAIGSVRSGALDIVVGPPHTKTDDPDHKLTSVPLYRAQLLAFVPEDSSPDDTVSVDDLARPDASKLLLPPSTTRAGRAIRSALLSRLDNSQDALDERIRLAAHGTKVLMILAAEALGIVVVPSDIAYSFSNHGVFHGTAFDGYKWVTVLDDNKPITHDVHATTRFWNSIHDSHVQSVMDQLPEAITSTFADYPFVGEAS